MMVQGLPPRITEIARPWWDALRAERIALQMCGGCGRAIFYPRPACPHCWSDDLHWREVTEPATLYSFTIAHVPVSTAFAHLQRPVLAIAELLGAHIPTTLEGIADADIRIGMTLQPLFDHETYPDCTLLRFTAAGSLSQELTPGG